MRVLAVNLSCDSVFANPRQISDKSETTKLLSSILRIREDFIYERLSRDKSFVWLKRKVSPAETEKIKKLNIEGVEILEESKRFYPNGNLGCHAIGTVDIDNNGLEGLELLYNSHLKGESGWLVSAQDARRRLIESYRDAFVPPKDGFNLILTIDEVIQHIAERELSKVYDKYNAKSASIIVMDPRFGDILALANIPNYDLNHPNSRTSESIRNRAINDFFEPGSVFKIVAASAGLEEHVVDLYDRFYCENGVYRVGRRVLHDHRPHGVLTFKEVIEKSSNIGTVKVASLFGRERMYKYVKAFGFCDRTGIDLPGEVVGMNRPVAKWSNSSMLAIPMGQEVTTTAIQLATAISVISNNGFLVRPRIVKEIVEENGEVVKENPPKVLRRVLSAKTASTMRKILMGVVETGTGRKARIEDYCVGGKTGTAQKVEKNGVYSHERFIASFIGFAPMDKPIVSVVVCIDEPYPVYYGGDVAAPVFKNVVDETLKYLNAKSALL